MQAWLAERAARDTDPAFTTRTGTALSRDAIEHLAASWSRSERCQRAMSR
jgi:hypothetical protein